jgi:hypothetical protein
METSVLPSVETSAPVDVPQILETKTEIPAEKKIRKPRVTQSEKKAKDAAREMYNKYILEEKCKKLSKHEAKLTALKNEIEKVRGMNKDTVKEALMEDSVDLNDAVDVEELVKQTIVAEEPSREEVAKIKQGKSHILEKPVKDRHEKREAPQPERPRPDTDFRQSFGRRSLLD